MFELVFLGTPRRPSAERGLPALLVSRSPSRFLILPEQPPGSLLTLRWRKTDSNPRSLSEGKCWKGRTSRRGGSFFAGGGTEGSNPSPSSAESANDRFLSSRQAITYAGTYQRLQGRRVAADTAIWHRKVRGNGRRYGREHRPADRWAPGPARLLFPPSYCRRSAPTLRSGPPRAASCRSLPR